MANANDILKMVYTVSWLDLKALQAHRPCAHKRVYEIFPDGKVIMTHKVKGDRKTLEKEERCIATKEDFLQLFEKLNQCISTADRLVEFADDHGAELKVYRAFGRVETMDRGYGNADEVIGDLLEEYLYRKAGF